MEVLLIIITLLLIAGGVMFSVLPPLPGPIISYLALISAHYIADETGFSTVFFIIWGVLAIVVIAGDYLLPIAATRKFGGTKAGITGGFIGTIAGIMLPIPFGIIIGPLLGAIIGDLVGGNHIRAAMKSGFGSFVGFIIGTSVKVLYSIILGGVIVYQIGTYAFSLIKEYF